jgi:Lon protease-like protein
MAEHLPLLRFGRAVIPGTRHAVRTDRDDLGVGDRIVVVLEQEDGSIGSVGTAGRIREIRARQGRVVLEVVGESLVVVAPDGSRAEVRPVDCGIVQPASDLVEAVERALRTYMAARAEAGEGGDVHVSIDRDPITASHQVASQLEISWPEVQEILEAGDAAERLEREIQVLRRETILLQAVLGRRV